MPSDVSQLHANNAVNGILARMLPGVSRENGKRVEKSKKGSKAQLIDRNLKRRVQLQEVDVEKLKRKQNRIRRREMRNQKRSQERLEQLAQLEVLEKHRKEGNLTKNESKHLNALVRTNEQRVKSWEMGEDGKEDLLELQEYILNKTTGANKASKSQKRKSKYKNFAENDKFTSSSARRYPGLTPGLAPVGMSDEEDSSEEEEEEL